MLRPFTEHKICLVGLDNAGKTTILYQFLMNEVVHTSPTIGSNVEEVVWNNIHFIMWDLGGQESLRTAWNTYYSNTEFILLVVDSTDRERLSITKEELHKMLQSDELCKASVLVFANKQVKQLKEKIIRTFWILVLFFRMLRGAWRLRKFPNS